MTHEAISSQAKPNEPMKPLKPWDGKAEKKDKILLATFFGVTALLLALRPLHPFLLADYPVLLTFLTGSTPAIATSAAFAKVQGASVVLPLLAGVVGSVKFSWIYWWAGRRWGKNIILMTAPTPGAARRFTGAQDKLWLSRIGLLLNDLPGAPSALIVLLAGWQRMSLGTFLALSSLGALLWTSVIVWIGYSLGQSVVDTVLLVEKYALWVSIGIVVWLAVFAGRRKSVKPELGATE